MVSSSSLMLLVFRPLFFSFWPLSLSLAASLSLMMGDFYSVGRWAQRVCFCACNPPCGRQPIKAAGPRAASHPAPVSASVTSVITLPQVRQWTNILHHKSRKSRNKGVESKIIPKSNLMIRLVWAGDATVKLFCRNMNSTVAYFMHSHSVRVRVRVRVHFDDTLCKMRINKNSSQVGSRDTSL